jgi:hypothetical protein
MTTSDSFRYKTMFCSGHVKPVKSGSEIIVNGIIEEVVKGDTISYLAAAPADHMANYTGSGLPFANQIQALENSPNVGDVRLNPDNSFEIKLIPPNSYMAGLGSITIPPSLYIRYTNGNDVERLITIKVSNGIPYRSMTYPAQRSSVSFYGSQFGLEVRSQERILREAGYPATNVMPGNHWGTKPPL